MLKLEFNIDTGKFEKLTNFYLNSKNDLDLKHKVWLWVIFKFKKYESMYLR